MFDTPQLKTQRVLLRLPVMADWPAYKALMLSDRANYMDGPYSERAAWGLFCSDVAQWGLVGHGALMIESRATGQCLGQVGVNHGPLFPERELGWFVYSFAEGKGYAYEAAKVLKDWALKTQGYETLVSYVDEGNTRSRNLVERLGGVLDSEARRPDASDLVYRYPAT